jgi:hypothetical protein
MRLLAILQLVAADLVEVETLIVIGYSYSLCVAKENTNTIINR